MQKGFLRTYLDVSKPSPLNAWRTLFLDSLPLHAYALNKWPLCVLWHLNIQAKSFPDLDSSWNIVALQVWYCKVQESEWEF